MFKINFDSTYRIDDGYGNSGEQILLALDRHPEITVFSDKNWSNFNKNGLEKRTLEIVNKGFKNSATYSIRYSQPDSFNNAPQCKRKKIGWSMWEFSKIPDAWKKGINEVDVRFVPCKHNQDIWKAAGAKTPTYIVNLGINSKIFYYKEKPKNRPFTFVISGTLSKRKQPNLVYNSFIELFGNSKDVRLIIKSSKRLPINLKPKSNIQIINETWPAVKMAELMINSDCFLYPTQGEGFGLSPLEALACGTTTICTNWSGPADYLDDSYSYKLDYKVNGSVGSHWGDRFKYAIPDKNHFMYLMKYVFNNQDEVKNKGILGADIVAKKFTWDNTANRLYSIFRELG